MTIRSSVAKKEYQVRVLVSLSNYHVLLLSVARKGKLTGRTVIIVYKSHYLSTKKTQYYTVPLYNLSRVLIHMCVPT